MWGEGQEKKGIPLRLSFYEFMTQLSLWWTKLERILRHHRRNVNNNSHPEKERWKVGKQKANNNSSSNNKETTTMEKKKMGASSRKRRKVVSDTSCRARPARFLNSPLNEPCRSHVTSEIRDWNMSRLVRVMRFSRRGHICVCTTVRSKIFVAWLTTLRGFSYKRLLPPRNSSSPPSCHTEFQS